MVLVVLLAGKSSDDVTAGATALREMQVKTIAVGMGSKYEEAQLTAMAFQASYVLKAASFSALTGIQGSLVSLISSGKKNTLPKQKTIF